MQRLIWFFCLALFAYNCAGETTTEAAEQTQEEMMATTEETPPTEKEAVGIINANIASARILAYHTAASEELIEQIIAGRPYLSPEDFQQRLSETMDEEAVKAFMATCFVPLNLNTATEEQFKMVPGVGDKMAHEFAEYRPYKKIEQFRREMGKYVDDAEITRYENYVFVPVDLNTATDEEILAIPGVGKKMLREFKEYRPYVSIEQFRREIGKYVDDGEVARLERFVYVDGED